MDLRMIGCTHRASDLDIRQKLAFGDVEATDALAQWQERFPTAEMVLISTCNRVELYAAGNGSTGAPECNELVNALLDYHQLPAETAYGQLLALTQRDAVAHLFRVAASLDSMVVGEPQILAQVKQAYQRSVACGATGPLLDDLFQSALYVARRVHNETDLHNHRVSIPSVAIADFASRVFERFDDKRVLVLGAGEMAEETLRYLKEFGAVQIAVANRNASRGRELADQWGGRTANWDDLWEEVAAADLVVSTTSADEPIVTVDRYRRCIAPLRQQRPLFVLDLAVPRDFDLPIGDEVGVYLYSIDDLQAACDKNREARCKELPAAESIIAKETERFLAEIHHRAAAPVITGLRRELERHKEAELHRLCNKLPDLDERSREELQRFADRLVNKMLHTPMASLRDESRNGPPHGLLDALRRLFRIDED